MKLSEIVKSAAPVSESPSQEPVAPEAEAPQEPQGTSTVTPSGVTIEYEWAPRRLYRLNGQEVPSVTTVLGVLDKSGPLTWWAQGIACEGIRKLSMRGLVQRSSIGELLVPEGVIATKDDLVALLTAERLSVNHVKDEAADRGVNVHGALEKWVADRTMPTPLEHPEHEIGYFNGLNSFLHTINLDVGEVESELMVGSLEHSYAGRFDLVLTLSKPVEVVTRCYPKKPSKVEEIPAGRYLMDLKTRKKAQVYNTNYLQLEAYEHAAVECGYPPTDYRAVIVVTEDGKYQVSVNQDWCFEDFLAVRRVYSVLNEREILRDLREELGAREVA